MLIPTSLIAVVWSLVLFIYKRLNIAMNSSGKIDHYSKVAE